MAKSQRAVVSSVPRKSVCTHKFLKRVDHLQEQQQRRFQHNWVHASEHGMTTTVWTSCHLSITCHYMPPGATAQQRPQHLGSNHFPEICSPDRRCAATFGEEQRAADGGECLTRPGLWKSGKIPHLWRSLNAAEETEPCGAEAAHAKRHCDARHAGGNGVVTRTV